MWWKPVNAHKSSALTLFEQKGAEHVKTAATKKKKKENDDLSLRKVSYTVMVAWVLNCSLLPAAKCSANKFIALIREL